MKYWFIGFLLSLSSFCHSLEAKDTSSIFKTLPQTQSILLAEKATQTNKVCCQLCKKDGKCLEKRVSPSACDDVKGMVVDKDLCEK